VTFPKLPSIKKLQDLSSPPKQLYYLGRYTPEIFKNAVAVVGSRRITEYGRRVIEKIIPPLVFNKQTIISGFMYGTDQYAHRVCLDNGGKTVAVLGWGLDKKLAGDDKKLADRIINSGGLIISEWETQEGTNWTFPVRDRIIAALADEVIVTEAAAKSGALITVRDAVKLKRKIWAVPGPITSKTSEGTNNLIAAGIAQIYLGQTTQQTLTFDNPILEILQNESSSADELARKLNKPVREIGSELTILLLSGKIREREGKYYLGE
jgi:DNA processing protein